ncbi:MerR family transcriptional regulator [Streptomyces cynarae]|uniref:MerR family transcriptional regulator n=1 Tax=Streptomyces cynarae TaxID=2981134 RepID=UPI00406C52C7
MLRITLGMLTGGNHFTRADFHDGPCGTGPARAITGTGYIDAGQTGSAGIPSAPEESRMRLAQLSDASGVSTATIKYYLREGLLRPGDRVSTTQTRYGEHHLHRLQLIRALIKVGGLSIAVVRDVLTSLDKPGLTPGDLVSACHVPPVGREVPASEQRADHEAAVSEILALAHRWGWRVSCDTPAVGTAAEALGALRRLSGDGIAERVDSYAQAAEIAAAADLNATRGTIREAMEALVVADVLGDVLLASLRRLAQVHHLRDSTPPVEAVAPSRGTALSPSSPDR